MTRKTRHLIGYSIWGTFIAGLVVVAWISGGWKIGLFVFGGLAITIAMWYAAYLAAS